METKNNPPSSKPADTAAVAGGEAAIKATLQSLIAAVLYVTMFAVLLPPLLRILDKPAGKLLYALLLAGAVAVALRLRHLARQL